MGIDVYMLWNGQTEEERKAQYTGFSIAHGHVGYLREAYHGAPYATEVLVPEGWEDESDDEEGTGGIAIPAATLRERLPKVLATAAERSRVVYNETLPEDHPVLESFRAFVALAEQKERETGEPVRIWVSA